MRMKFLLLLAAALLHLGTCEFQFFVLQAVKLSITGSTQTNLQQLCCVLFYGSSFLLTLLLDCSTVLKLSKRFY